MDGCILLDSGISQEKAEAAQQLYKETVEENYFMASNLTENKTTLSSSGVTVSISGDIFTDCRKQLAVKFYASKLYEGQALGVRETNLAVSISFYTSGNQHCADEDHS